MSTDNTQSRRSFLQKSAIAGTASLTGFAGCLSQDAGTADTSFEEIEQIDDTDELMEMAEPPEEILFVERPINGMEKIHYADENGIFSDRGLNVQYAPPVFADPLILQTLILEDAHIGMVNTTAPINFARQHERYAQLIYPDAFFAPSLGYPGLTWTIVPEEVESYADLEGETFGFIESEVIRASISWNLDQAGADPSDFDISYMPAFEVPGAVARGEVGAGITFEPAIVLAKSRGIGVERLVPHYGWLHPGTIVTWLAAPDFVQEYPYTVQLIQDSLREVQVHFADDETRPEYFDFAANYFETPREVFDELWENGWWSPPWVDFWEPNPYQSYVKTQDLLLEYIPTVQDSVDVKNFFLPWNDPDDQ